MDASQIGLGSVARRRDRGDQQVFLQTGFIPRAHSPAQKRHSGARVAIVVALIVGIYFRAAPPIRGVREARNHQSVFAHGASLERSLPRNADRESIRRCAGFGYGVILISGPTTDADRTNDFAVSLQWDTAGENHDLAVVRGMDSKELAPRL